MAEIIIDGVRDPSTGEFVSSPTFAAGDAKIIIPPSAPTATTNTPALVSTYSTAVKIELEAAEEVDGAIVQLIDQTVSAEWEFPYDLVVSTTGDVSSDISSINTTLAALTTITPPATSRANGTTLKAFVGETVPFPTITPRDVDGSVLDTTTITLQVVIEGRTDTDIVTVADGSITKTTTTIQFSGPSAANTTVSQKKWAVRRTDNNVVVAHGPYVVDYAAKAD